MGLDTNIKLLKKEGIYKKSWKKLVMWMDLENLVVMMAPYGSPMFRGLMGLRQEK